MKLLKEDNFFREIDIGIASNRPMAFLHRTEINDGGFTNLNRESRVFSSAVHLKNLEVSFLFSKNELRTLKSIARNNASKTLNVAALLIFPEEIHRFQKEKFHNWRCMLYIRNSNFIYERENNFLSITNRLFFFFFFCLVTF